MSRDFWYRGVMARDHVDTITEQWARERPDVDVSGMAVIGRISRLARTLESRLDEVFAAHALEAWEFDLLAALRRSGDPYQLTAGQLVEAMMITSGAVTNRLDRLEARGLIRRQRSPHDGRVVLARLTPDGFATIDAAVVDHAANEIALVSALDADEQRHLQDLLRRLHVSVAGPSGRG